MSEAARGRSNAPPFLLSTPVGDLSVRFTFKVQIFHLELKTEGICKAKNDGFVKSPIKPIIVIPVKTGIQ